MAQLAQLVIGMLEFTSVKSRVYRGSVAEGGTGRPGHTGGWDVYISVYNCALSVRVVGGVGFVEA